MNRSYIHFWDNIYIFILEKIKIGENINADMIKI